jgi:hypothetical protein
MSLVYSSNRFNTPGLVVVPELVGSEHEFQFEGRQAKVALPPSAELDRERVGDYRRYVIGTRQAVDNAPLNVHVHDVDVTVDVPDSPQIEAMRAEFEAKSRDPALLPEWQATERFALMSFDHWLRVIRWKCGYGSIGRLARHQREHWGTYLCDAKTHARFPGPTVIVVPFEPAVSVEQWAATGSALRDGRTSPLFYDLYFDAIEHLSDEDTRRTVIDLTSACEVLLKTVLDAALPTGTLPAARKQLLKAPASVLLRDFLKPLLGAGADHVSSHRRSFEELLKARNDVTHGHRPNLPSTVDCKRFGEAVRALLTVGSEVLDQLQTNGSATAQSE